MTNAMQRRCRVPRAALFGALTAALLATAALAAPKSAPLTLTEGTNFAVATAPDGHAVAFDFLGHLWLMPPKGGEARQLTGIFDDIRLPTWSPDSKQIAFQSYRDGNWHVWVIDESGSNLRQLTKGAQDDRDVTWDPSGQVLYMSSDSATALGRYRIRSLQLATNETTLITPGDVNSYSPAIREDGALAYISKGLKRGAPVQIVLKTGTTSRTVFQTTSDELAGLSWLPDGRLSVVAFDSVWNSRYTKLLAINTENGEAESLSAPDEDVFPFRTSRNRAGEVYYAADGQIKRRDTSGKTERVHFMATIDIEGRPPVGTQKKYDFFDSTPRPVKGILNPVLSPDGKTVAFSALGELWWVGTDGAAHQITNDKTFSNIDPAYSPDGASLAYVSDRTGLFQLWIRNLKDGSERRIPTPEGVYEPTWTPDGKKIAVLQRPFGGQGFQLIDVETGASKPLSKKLRGRRITWSPDGHRATSMTNVVAESPLYREGGIAIDIVDIEKDEATRIQAPEGAHFGTRDFVGTSWSPDGRYLATLLSHDLWLYPVDSTGKVNGQARKLAEGVDAGLSWNGDGTQILIQSGTHLRKINVNTGASTEIPVNLTWRPYHDDSRLVLRAGRVFDGVHEEYQRNLDLLIEGNRIVDMVPSGSAKSKAFGGRLVDASDKVVIPGLIDAHAHTAATEMRQELAWLTYGVTTTRSPGGGNPYEGLERRESLATGARIGPRLLVSGRKIDGRRGGEVVATSPEELKHDLQLTVDLEFDFIKTYVRLPPDLQKIVIDFTNSHGTYVTSHNFYPSVAMGVGGKEHLRAHYRDGFGTALSLRNRVYSDVPALVARSGAPITATVSLLAGNGLEALEHPEYWDDPRWAAFSTEEERRSSKEGALRGVGVSLGELQALVAEIGQSLGKIVHGGGKILAGTDCPIIECGPSLHNELYVSVAGNGMKPFEALLSATAWSADAIGIGAQVGRLMPNMVADMAILDGDPLANISDTRKVTAVVTNGRYFTVPELIAKSPLH